MVAVIRGDDDFDSATSGVLEFQSTSTISNVASVEINLDSSADYHIFQALNVIPVSGNVSIYVQFYSGAAYVSTGYYYQYLNLYSSSVSTNESANASDVRLTSSIDISKAYGANGVFTLSGTQSASTYPNFMGDFFSEHHSFVWHDVYRVNGILNSASAITKVKFYVNSGNLSSGSISYYSRRS